MHCPTGLDYSNSEQKRRKPVEIKRAKQRLSFCPVFVDGDIPWIPVGRTMNRLQSSAKKNAVEVLTEDLLWAKGLLGGETPKMLLDSVVFYNGLYFALRSGREHRLLRHSPCRVEVVEKPGERPYLLYHKDRDTSRNHPSRLQGCKTMPKVVVRYSNTQNPERCFVALFKKYRQLCPDNPVDRQRILPATIAFSN